jgi:hypothetical protein
MGNVDIGHRRRPRLSMREIAWLNVGICQIPISLTSKFDHATGGFVMPGPQMPLEKDPLSSEGQIPMNLLPGLLRDIQAKTNYGMKYYLFVLILSVSLRMRMTLPSLSSRANWQIPRADPVRSIMFG